MNCPLYPLHTWGLHFYTGEQCKSITEGLPKYTSFLVLRKDADLYYISSFFKKNAQAFSQLSCIFVCTLFFVWSFCFFSTASHKAFSFLPSGQGKEVLLDLCYDSPYSCLRKNSTFCKNPWSTKTWPLDHLLSFSVTLHGLFSHTAVWNLVSWKSLLIRLYKVFSRLSYFTFCFVILNSRLSNEVSCLFCGLFLSPSG